MEPSVTTASTPPTEPPEVTVTGVVPARQWGAPPNVVIATSLLVTPKLTQYVPGSTETTYVPSSALVEAPKLAPPSSAVTSTQPPSNG